MTENVYEPEILVPIDASEPAEPPQALVDLLGPHELVILGYYPVPDQTATEQSRAEFGEEATAAIERITDHFVERGAGAESLVVFTHDRGTTIDNVAADYEVDAVLTPGEIGDKLDRILVPLRGDTNLDRILAFVGVLLRKSDAKATIFHVAESEEEASRSELLVRGACDRLEDEEGIESTRIDWRQDRNSSATRGIIEAATDFDLLVVGESKPSLTERVLGEVSDTVIDKSSDPLLIVRDR